MTPTEQKGLTQAIQANRRALSLLDKRIEDLAKTHPSLLAEYDVDDKQPFLYGAIGTDNKLGILIDSATPQENPAFGYIRTHPDSAFVLTRISMASSDTKLAFNGPRNGTNIESAIPPSNSKNTSAPSI